MDSELEQDCIKKVVRNFMTLTLIDRSMLVLLRVKNIFARSKKRPVTLHESENTSTKTVSAVTLLCGDRRGNHSNGEDIVH